ncbi:protein containing RHS repeat-associated core domain [Anaerolinea thermolimosa]|uniref:polymorphic toxin type 44 domain-containing protein n=1 Tax=Anaerolinea thermolimosa TaxID=229919 RepID=UPI000783F575|nr:polymorphic toxin type 44 domain-containing protein [Anaerolinea thermolimosa]GAP06339.1 protein containing RHS repeat-associated core domain [Anaerolinea thermolimosa]
MFPQSRVPGLNLATLLNSVKALLRAPVTWLGELFGGVELAALVPVKIYIEELQTETHPPAGQVWKNYILVGGQRVAVREYTSTSSTVYFLLGDHLGSVSVVTDAATGVVVGQIRYSAYGEERYTSGMTPTDYRYTGQLSRMTEIGLYHYGARWFDPALAHFVQADTVVPDASNPATFDRFAYTRNNPIRYNDPTGHDVGCTGYDASRCEGIYNNLGKQLQKREYTIPPVVKYITDEIRKNIQGDTVRGLKALNKQNTTAPKLIALAVWASKVAPGQEWDHKPDIQAMEKDASRDPEFQQAGTKAYKYDTWSNIHYGFVGTEAGFDQDTLLDGAGVAQFIVDLIKANRDPVADLGVKGARKYDQLQDRVTIQIGIDLWNQYGADLQPEDIIWVIEHTSGIETRP